VTVEEEKDVEVTTTTTTSVNIVEQEQSTTEQKHSDSEVHHPTKDEIDEYEESQKKFHELWELKREKVNFVEINLTFSLKIFLIHFQKKLHQWQFF
jgi:hypothetical protein